MTENFMRLDADTARSLAYCQPGEQYAGYEVVENELVDTTRWDVVYFLIIQEIGVLGFWGTNYSKGATEYQSNEPFEDENTAEFYRVKPETVQSVKWVAIRE